MSGLAPKGHWLIITYLLTAGTVYSEQITGDRGLLEADNIIVEQPARQLLDT